MKTVVVVVVWWCEFDWQRQRRHQQHRQLQQRRSVDIYVYDTASGVRTLVSHASTSSTSTANAATFDPRMSGNGNRITYRSLATDLVTGFVDGNGSSEDVYAYTLATNTNALVTHIPGSPVTGGDGATSFLQISDDGGRIAFDSRASNLVSGQSDPNGILRDLFVHEVATGTTTLVTRTTRRCKPTSRNSSR